MINSCLAIRHSRHFLILTPSQTWAFIYCICKCECKCTRHLLNAPQPTHNMQLGLFLWRMLEGVAEHSFLGCNHQSTCMPSYCLHVQLLWYPMYYPGGMKVRISPVQ